MGGKYDEGLNLAQFICCTSDNPINPGFGGGDEQKQKGFEPPPGSIFGSEAPCLQIVIIGFELGNQGRVRGTSSVRPLRAHIRFKKHQRFMAILPNHMKRGIGNDFLGLGFAQEICGFFASACFRINRAEIECPVFDVCDARVLHGTLKR